MNHNESVEDNESNGLGNESRKNSSSINGEIEDMTHKLGTYLINELNIDLSYEDNQIHEDETACVADNPEVSTILEHSAFKIETDTKETNFGFSNAYQNCYQVKSQFMQANEIRPLNSTCSSFDYRMMNPFQANYNHFQNNFYYPPTTIHNQVPSGYYQNYLNNHIYSSRFANPPINAIKASNTTNSKDITKKEKKKKDNQPKKQKVKEVIESQYTSIEEFLYDCDTPVEYINSQQGSKTMQSLLAFLPLQSNYIGELLDKLGNGIISIMKDTYGNYFIQKLIKLLDTDSLNDVLTVIIKNNIIELSNHKYANHIVKSIIENIKDEQKQSRIINAALGNFKEMAFNAYGTHVLQSIMINFSETSRRPLTIYIEENFFSLAMDINAVCLVKKFIIVHSQKDINFKLSIVNKAYPFIPKLINSPAGNFVISCFFEEWGMDISAKIVSYFENNLYSLTNQKYSSLLLVKCLELGDPVRSLF